MTSNKELRQRAEEILNNKKWHQRNGVYVFSYKETVDAMIDFLHSELPEKYSADQIRQAGKDGEISSIDVEHLINILGRYESEVIQFGMFLTGHGKEDITQLYNDWKRNVH